MKREISDGQSQLVVPMLDHSLNKRKKSWQLSDIMTHARRNRAQNPIVDIVGLSIYFGFFGGHEVRLVLVVFWVIAICATNSNVSHKSVVWHLFDTMYRFHVLGDSYVSLTFIEFGLHWAHIRVGKLVSHSHGHPWHTLRRKKKGRKKKKKEIENKSPWRYLFLIPIFFLIKGGNSLKWARPKAHTAIYKIQYS